MGMCFGACGGLQRANGVEWPEGATIHGELVHNPTDAKRMEEAGSAMVFGSADGRLDPGHIDTGRDHRRRT